MIYANIKKDVKHEFEKKSDNTTSFTESLEPLQDIKYCEFKYDEKTLKYLTFDARNLLFNKYDPNNMAIYPKSKKSISYGNIAYWTMISTMIVSTIIILKNKFYD